MGRSRDWYSVFQVDLRAYQWLSPLRDSVSSIANFGCWTGEPFALLKVLDGTELVVVEKEKRHLERQLGPKELHQKLRDATDELKERRVEFVRADMTEQVEELPYNHFDLAFCRNVLEGVHWAGLEQGKSDSLQNAIREMARVVKPGGLVIADERPIYPEYEKVAVEPSEFLGLDALPRGIGEPLDLGPLFEAAGLARVDLEGSPGSCHCYRKFQGSA